MGAMSLLAEAKAAGLRISLQGEVLVIEGDEVHERLALLVLDHRSEVITLRARRCEQCSWPLAISASPTRLVHHQCATWMSTTCGSCGRPVRATTDDAAPRCASCIVTTRHNTDTGRTPTMTTHHPLPPDEDGLRRALGSDPR